MFAGVEELQEIHDLREDVDTGQAELSVDDYAYEELLDRLSQLAVELVARWRHDPRQRPNRSFLNDPRAAEIYLNVLRNPAYEPGIEVITELMDEHPPQRVGRTESNGARTTMDAQEQGELAEFLQKWLRFAARTLSLPRLYDAVAHASDVDWHRAQQDFQRVLSTLALLVRRASHLQGREVPDIGLFKYNVVGHLGNFFVPFVLALRRAGYAHWIERGLSFLDFMDDQLSAASFEDWASGVAGTQTHVETREPD